MIDGRQIRAARAMLGWSREDLLKASGISMSALLRMEGALADKLCIVLSVNSILPVVCWAGISGATRLRSPPSRQREGGSDAMTSRKECNPHGNTSRNQPLGSRLCDLARERTGWR
ncbi:helix-turn-helix domain-containing protein, partial [Tepidimonas thermarum]|uniref:helix-turn-helix domain-containing protein n=1 Tax=Tepidimonas thermarum TaxID=335431 RepID=UPI001C8F6A09